MRFIDYLAHLFVPRFSNNQKARILHSSGMSVLAVILIIFQFAINALPKTFPSVLGYAANISPSDVIRLTNDRRLSQGLSPLSENSTLSSAALAKGNDMLAKGYWAHFAPDGTSPWSFFQTFGYKYKYAGENLARDFSSSGGAVEAWMASPTHRDNILNPNYREIGIGVVEGNLSGVETTIIVQFFGTPQTAQAAIPVVGAQEVSQKIAIISTPTPRVALVTPAPTVIPEVVQTPVPTPSTPSPSPVAEVVTSTSLISPFSSSKNMSIAIVTLLLIVLAVDLIIVRRRKIVRIGGRTLAHLAFFGMILAVIIILKAGKVI